MTTNEWIEKVKLEIRALDLQAERIVDADEVIIGYKMNTGCWHRLLGLLASIPDAAAPIAAQKFRNEIQYVDGVAVGMQWGAPVERQEGGPDHLPDIKKVIDRVGPCVTPQPHASAVEEVKALYDPLQQHFKEHGDWSIQHLYDKALDLARQLDSAWKAYSEITVQASREWNRAEAAEAKMPKWVRVEGKNVANARDYENPDTSKTVWTHRQGIYYECTVTFPPLPALKPTEQG